VNDNAVIARPKAEAISQQGAASSPCTSQRRQVTRGALALLLLPVLALAQTQAPEAKPDSFSAVATPPEVKFGGEVRYVITVHHPKSDTYSLSGDLDLSPFQVISVSKARSDKGNEATTDFTLVLSMLDLGDKKIPDVTLFAEGPGGTRRLVVPGPSVKGVSDLPTDAQLRDIRGPASVWVRSFRSLFIAAAILALVLAGWLIYRSVSRRTPAVSRVPPELAHVRALRELQALREEDLPGKGRKKEMFFRMSEIVRRYIGDRYAFNAVDLTTPELLASLRKVSALGLDYGEFQRFCEQTDLVKFAKLDPSDAECMQTLSMAVGFVERTRPVASTAGSTAQAA
jgi:hypothetical protein